MKLREYKIPNSSFLAMEKDLNIIVENIFKNNNLKKLLYYTVPDALAQPSVPKDKEVEMFGKNIKIIPKLYADDKVLNYVIISFDSFTPNATNPEFRNSILTFDIVCHYDQWHLRDFQLRPYKIAGEIDSMFNGKHLTGIGELEFLGATQSVFNSEFAGLTLMYLVINGEEDKKKPLTEEDEELLIENFNQLFNQ